MSAAASAKLAMLGGAPRASVAPVEPSAGSALDEFEHVYRANVDAVMAYFARRCAEPQTVADLTSETFVRAAGTFASFDPDKGSPRAWLFGIAAHVFARHSEQTTHGRRAAARLAGRRPLDVDEIDELVSRVALRRRLSRARSRLRKEHQRDG